jgi:tryptophan synthase beta subunit
MARDKSIIEDAYAGDVVGLFDTGNFKIGDTLTEGIIPALESSHAIGYLLKNKNKFRSNDIVVVGLSGRGDKDVMEVERILGHKNEK